MDITIKKLYDIIFTYFYKQEPTHRKVGNKPDFAPRNFSSMVRPTCSNLPWIALHQQVKVVGIHVATI